MNDEQIRRYLDQYGLVLITNFREFRLLKLEAGTIRTLECYELAVTAAAFWSAPLASFAKHTDLLPDFLARVMLYKAPLVQPKDWRGCWRRMRGKRGPEPKSIRWEVSMR